MKQQILISRHYLLSTKTAEDKLRVAYLNAYLFSNFGILVDKPELLTTEHVKEISKLYKLNVPNSFYKNPQDTKYYSREELFVNQVVSYFFAYGAEDSAIDLFKDEKTLPEYPEGEEIKLREFKILTEAEADRVLSEIAKAYCEYKRPWSSDEAIEFNYLYNNGYYSDYSILCGDNAMSLLEKDIRFARFLFKKDLVKLSISRCGESSKLVLDVQTSKLIREALPLVKDCPMTKKQAKYFNTLVKKTGVKLTRKTSNFHSPYRLATEALNKGDVLGAAHIYAASGSLFERNIRMLLSRATPAEALELIEMIPAKNPIALYQFMSTLMRDTGENRTFTFAKNRLVKKHIETEYEAKWRKSRLNEATRKLVHDTVFNKIKEAYKTQPSLGKVYISDEFYKVGIPVNTSASGKGIDVLPIGSRLPITEEAIRTFVHWEKAFDIDSSLIIIDKKNNVDTMYFGNYYTKPYGDSILFSGDVTSPTGTEYYDIKLDKLRSKGIKYIIQTFHGFCSDLSKGEIYCGYQNKKSLNTKTWDPKNIELKIHVKGDTRAFMSFGIDLETNEIVIFNTLLDSDSRVVSSAMKDTIMNYLASSYLELNMGLVASYRAAEIVSDPAKADVVFDSTYKQTINEGIATQKVIRPYDIEALAALASGASI